MSSGHLVKIDGDTAALRSHWIAVRRAGDGPGDRRAVPFQAARRGDRWRLTAQRIEMIDGKGETAPAFREAMERQRAGQGRRCASAIEPEGGGWPGAAR